MTDDEILWRVNEGRCNALSQLNTRVSGGAFGKVLYYPGCGDDIVHALFSSRGATKYFIFVDINASLSQDLDGALKGPHEALSATELGNHRSHLNILTAPTNGWKFQFEGSERILLFFRSGSDQFLEASPAFQFDIFFDKDFWETGDTHPMELIMSRIKLNGFYLTNSSMGAYPYISIMGFTQHPSVVINGTQYVWEKSGASGISWTMMNEGMEAAKVAVRNTLFGDTDLTMDSDGWTEENWTDVLCIALARTRKSLLAKIPLFPPTETWNASSWFILDVLKDAAHHLGLHARLGPAKALAMRTSDGALILPVLYRVRALAENPTMKV